MIEPVLAPYFPSRILPPLVPGVVVLCTHQLNLKYNNSNIFNQPFRSHTSLLSLCIEFQFVKV